MATKIEKAHIAVANALRQGNLQRSEICEKCRRRAYQIYAHHHLGYDRVHWLDVIWLCASCHLHEHRRDHERRCVALNRLDERCSSIAMKDHIVCYVHRGQALDREEAS